jgi:hypothetical protein
MLPVFMILRRLVQALVAAWKSDPEFRVLVFLVVSILVSGTTFYTFGRGGAWWTPSTSASPR